MRVKSVVSIFALTSAMIVGPAFAQDAMASWTIGGVAVAEQDQAAVQARCDALAAENTSPALDPSSVTTDSETGADDQDSPAAQTSTNENPPAEGLDNAATTIDLSTITTADCVAGGWTAAQ